MFVDFSAVREPEVDRLSRARGLGLGVLLSTLIWGLLAAIKLTWW